LLPQLTKPFFRGDSARTAATGAGLGLAIVEKAMQRMGGTFRLSNAPDGGLVAHLRLTRAKPGAEFGLTHPGLGVSLSHPGHARP
jgi:signal transduction histidine kinase